MKKIIDTLNNLTLLQAIYYVENSGLSLKLIHDMSTGKTWEVNNKEVSHISVFYKSLDSDKASATACWL